MGEKKRFFLGPDLEVMFTAPEECECERKDDNEVIITLSSLQECKIHLDIVPYNQSLGNYYNRDPDLINGCDLRTLREDIQHKFEFDQMLFGDIMLELMTAPTGIEYGGVTIRKIKEWGFGYTNSMDG